MFEVRSIGIAAALVNVGMAFYPRSAYAGNDIGIIKGTQGCPAGTQEIEFLLDNEDSGNKNLPYGWIGGIEQRGNTHLKFCRVDGDEFFASGPEGGFVVLSLAPECPANTLRFSRSIDDEDDDNANRVRRWPDQPRSVAPNVSNKYNTKLYFCFSYNYGDGRAANFQHFDVEYGVFATQQSLVDINGLYGYVFMDDENSDNADRFSYDWTLNPYDWLTERVRAIIQPIGEKRGEVCYSPYACTRNNGTSGCFMIDTSCSCDAPCEEAVTSFDGVDTRLNIARIY